MELIESSKKDFVILDVFLTWSFYSNIILAG